MFQDESNSRGIAILGSTGSVGKNTLDVIARNPEHFHVVALSANRSVDELFEQINQFTPNYVVMVDQESANQLSARLTTLSSPPKLLVGVEGLNDVVVLPEVDCVMAAIVGGAGLASTLTAARAGKMVLLANKEALVMAGELLLKEASDNNAILLPIDSEHNAVFQCMENTTSAIVKTGVASITLTASGGPFLDKTLDQLYDVTPEQACAHPNWKMGRKISVDSASMMNKGLEVIEACLLFDLDVSKINVVIHPQSIIHAMVNYKDGSILAQMGYPDMRIPISHALAWPARFESGVANLDITEHSGLEFYQPNLKQFPCLELAFEAQKSGGTSPLIMNAANEIAVAAFLEGKIKFPDIYHVVARVLDQLEPEAIESVEMIMHADTHVRHHTIDVLEKLIH